MTQPDELDQLVKELREYRSFCEAHGAYTEEHEICDRAADAIQALRNALKEIADYSPAVKHGWAEHVRHIARKALDGEMFDG